MIQPGPIDARSFRDPDGFVRVVGDRVLRLVEHAAAERLDAILARPSVREAMAAGRIVGTRRAAPASVPAPLRELNCAIYEHDRIAFVSYAHEWPPAMLARAVNGTASFFPTLGGAFVLVMLHRAFAFAALRSHGFGDLVKGRSDVIIRDGKLDEARAMRNLLSRHDIMEDLRLHGNVDDIADVSLAVLERNGHISVVKRK